MTNTQSPAPGVAAEVDAAVAFVMENIDDYEDQPSASFRRYIESTVRTKLTELARTALQASAAAVERRRTEYTPAGHPISVVDGGPLDSAPLPAKVQEADLWKIAMDAFTETQDKTESIKDAWQRVVDRVLASSRTPAPGMAGGVGALCDCQKANVCAKLPNCRVKFSMRQAAANPGKTIEIFPAAPHPSPAPQAATEAQKMLNWLLDGKRSKRIWNHVLTDEEKAGHNFIKDVLHAAITASGRDAS